MFIEIHIAGQLLHRWEITDDNFLPIEGATWQENVIAREMIIDQYLHQMEKFADPLLSKLPTPQYYLVYPSKGNNIPIADEPEKFETLITHYSTQNDGEHY